MTRPAAIRPAAPEDMPALAALSRALFTEYFGHLYTPENLSAFLGEYHSEEYYRIQHGKRECRMLLLESGGVLSGFITFGAVQIPAKDDAPEAGEIHRIYLKPAERGNGSGRALMEQALSALEREGKRRIYLGVWEENTRAQAFYRRFGFEKYGEYLFLVGTHADREWIMRLDMSAA